MGTTKAPEGEIEITDAMIEAGCEALSMFDRGDRMETMVWAVFGAMASKAGMKVKAYDDPKLPGLCR